MLIGAKAVLYLMEENVLNKHKRERCAPEMTVMHLQIVGITEGAITSVS